MNKKDVSAHTKSEVRKMDQNKNPVLPTEEMQRYFATLPPFVQETIMQENVSFQGIEDLRSCAEQLLKKQQ